MKLTIENVKNIIPASIKTNVKILNASGDGEVYFFGFKHRNFKGDFGYSVHRDMVSGGKYVGTFRHPYGSNRHDCYEMDLLDKISFLDFLDILVQEWYVQHNQ